MNQNLTPRSAGRLPAPESQNQLDRLESKVDALRSALSIFAAPDPWQAGAADPDADLHSSKLSQYWRALRLRKGILLLTALVGLIAGGLFTFSQTPVYRAETAIEIIGVNENFLNTRDVNPMDTGGYTTDSYIQTQAELLTSTSLVNRAVGASGAPREASAAPRRPGKLSALLQSMGLRKPPKPPVPGDAARAAAANLKVQPRRGTRLIDIQYDSEDPKRASEFANALAKAYIDYTLEMRTETSQETANLLNHELDSLERKLHESEANLQEYANRKQLVFTDDKATVQSEKLRDVQAELSRAQADRIARQSAFEMATVSSPEALPQVMDSPSLREYQSKIGELQRQLAELKTIYAPEYYKIKRTEAQIAELRGLFNAERANIVTRTRNEYDTAIRRERLLTEALATQSRVVSDQGKDAVAYNLLKGQVDTYKSLYDNMLQKAKSAGLASALRESTARVVEPAETPTAPYKPNFPLNCAIGLLTGILGGVGLVIARDQADRTLKNPGDPQLYANLPELAVIPSVAADPYLRKLPAGQIWIQRMLGQPSQDVESSPLPARAPELAVWRHKPTLMAETFRGLLTSILFSSPDEHNLRVLVMTSPGPGEGKSTITSNLAIATAEVRQSVLLIDADARKPRIHEIFNVSNARGLTTYLTGQVPLDEDAIDELIVDSGVPGLSIMPSGPGHESFSALLHSERLTELLQLLRPRFNSIVIDTPPVLQVPDARILARRADAVIVVARAGRTTRDALLLAKQRFADDGVPVLGAILNDWHPKSDPTAVYYNPGYYQKNPPGPAA